MKKYLIILCSLILATACQKEILIPEPEPEEDQSYTDHIRHTEYSTQLENYRMTTHAPGAVLLISRQGEPLWVGAAGKSNLAHQISMHTGAGIGYGKNGSIAGTEANVVYFPESGNLFVLYKNNGNGSDKSFWTSLCNERLCRKFLKINNARSSKYFSHLTIFADPFEHSVKD
ncbi:MAG: hypothetical protein R2824_21800 [Saprospiraceae bacterium]|nr:hypothetical protein [Lewinella sp.]